MKANEAIEEARENIGKNFSTEPCVVKVLLIELEHARSERDQAQAKLALAADTIIESNYYGGFAAPRGAAKVLHAVLNLILPNDQDEARAAQNTNNEKPN